MKKEESKDKKISIAPNSFVPIDSKLIFGNISTGISLNEDPVKRNLKQLSRVTLHIEENSQLQEIYVKLNL